MSMKFIPSTRCQLVIHQIATSSINCNVCRRALTCRKVPFRPSPIHLAVSPGPVLEEVAVRYSSFIKRSLNSSEPMQWRDVEQFRLHFSGMSS